MDVALVDWPLFHRFAKATSAEIALDLVERSLETAGTSCRRMQEQFLPPQEIAKEAHRLRGSMGMLGLSRIGQLAGAIEDAIREGGDFSGLLEALSNTVGQTCSEFSSRKTPDRE